MANGPPGLAESRRGTPIGPPSKSKAQIGRELDREITRKTFFDGRQDVSDDRLDRRKKQADEYVAFKTDPTKTKAVEGITGLFQAATPGGKTLAEKEMELAKKYGPTLSEIGSDVAYRGGKIIGALGEKALSGGLGFLAVFRDIVNYATNKGNKNYDKLNDVEKEIYDNPDKHPLTSKGLPSLKEIAQSTDLINKAEKDALGLQIDKLILGKEIDELQRQKTFRRTPGTGYQAGAGLTTLPTPEISIDFPTRDPVFPAEEIKQSALDRFSPEYLEQQKALLDELNISPQVAELLGPNAPGGRQEEFYVSPGDQDFDAGKPYGLMGSSPYGASIDKTPGLAAGTTFPGSFKSLEFDDLLGRESSEGTLVGGQGGTQVTAFNNPGNLTDVGQAGTTGETYGNNFAVFPNAQVGIAALEKDLELKVNRSNKVDDIIGQYAAGDPNVNRYIDFVTDRVGETVDQNELDDLRDAVITFENKPDIAQQYLALVADGGLIDKKMYGGIIASKK
tara:strand:- start:56 stop:1573 length:1518 start_codon:yes stop_codon:yes gene_type:complete